MTGKQKTALTIFLAALLSGCAEKYFDPQIKIYELAFVDEDKITNFGKCPDQDAFKYSDLCVLADRFHLLVQFSEQHRTYIRVASVIEGAKYTKSKRLIFQYAQVGSRDYSSWESAIPYRPIVPSSGEFTKRAYEYQGKQYYYVDLPPTNDSWPPRKIQISHPHPGWDRRIYDKISVEHRIPFAIDNREYAIYLFVGYEALLKKRPFELSFPGSP